MDKKYKIIIYGIIINCLLINNNSSWAQDSQEKNLMCVNEQKNINDYLLGVYHKEEQKLFEHMHKEIIMCKKSKQEDFVYYKFCREDKICVYSVMEYAKYIFQYAIEFDLDPWLIAAIALHESNYNAFAIGKKGEKGLMQLHPNSPWGKKSKFVKNKQYWKYCKNVIGHCQWEVIGIAAETLKGHLRAFGELEKALSAYNTGSPNLGNKKYVKSVKDKREILIKGKIINNCN